jgi:hypothetical protein
MATCENLIALFLAAPDHIRRLTVARQIDQRDDAEAVYAEIRDKISESRQPTDIAGRSLAEMVRDERWQEACER